MGVRSGAAVARGQLEALVPADHLLRRVDRALDLAGGRGELAACSSRIGRPSVDPELLLRLPLVGYLWASKGGPARLAYYVNYLVDNARGVIADVEATAARYSAEAAGR